MEVFLVADLLKPDVIRKMNTLYPHLCLNEYWHVSTSVEMKAKAFEHGITGVSYYKPYSVKHKEDAEKTRQDYGLMGLERVYHLFEGQDKSTGLLVPVEYAMQFYSNKFSGFEDCELTFGNMMLSGALTSVQKFINKSKLFIKYRKFYQSSNLYVFDINNCRTNQTEIELRKSALFGTIPDKGFIESITEDIKISIDNLARECDEKIQSKFQKTISKEHYVNHLRLLQRLLQSRISYQCEQAGVGRGEIQRLWITDKSLSDTLRGLPPAYLVHPKDFLYNINSCDLYFNKDGKTSARPQENWECISHLG